MSLDREQSKKFISGKYRNSGGIIIKIGLLTIMLSTSLLMSSSNFNIINQSNHNNELSIQLIASSQIKEALNEKAVKQEIKKPNTEKKEKDPVEIIEKDPYLLIDQQSVNIKERIKNDDGTHSIFINHDTYVISDELLNKINNLIFSYPSECAFYVVTLDGKMSMGYNIDYSFHSASAVKAPYTLYCMKEIENNNIDFNEELIYKPQHYEIDTSIINDYSFYTPFTLDQVLYYTIHESDNVGYYMLQDRFSTKGYDKMLEELGCNKMMLNGAKWGNVNAREMLTIWNEIYRYSRVSDIGSKYMDLLKGAKYNFIKQGIGEEYEIAHKSGYNSKAQHDVAIVYGKTPYLITVMTKNPSKTNFIQNMSSYLNEAVNEYENLISKQKIK